MYVWNVFWHLWYQIVSRPDKVNFNVHKTLAFNNQRKEKIYKST